MNTLNSLKLVSFAAARTASNPQTVRRSKLADKISEQIAAAKAASEGASCQRIGRPHPSKQKRGVGLGLNPNTLHLPFRVRLLQRPRQPLSYGMPSLGSMAADNIMA